MSLLRSFATISGLTMVSRVLGFLRDVQMAALLGAGPISDAFFVAFKLPNFFRKLFAEGAFNAAFVPLFSGMLASEGKDPARQFAREALSALTFVLLILSALAMVAMPWVTIAMAPGFSDDPEKLAVTVELSRITFPYLLFISITSLLVGVLNSMDRFAAGAAAPILLNICFIVGLGLFSHAAETPAHVAAWCVFAAGLSQCVLLLWCVRRTGMWLRPQWPRFTPNVRKLLRLMGPAALGGSVTQISMFIDVIIASTIPQAVSYLYYADRVMELPLGVIGIAIGTAVLPVLSRQWRLGERDKALHTQNRALELAMFFSLPAALALIAIAYPVVSVLFEYGKFEHRDAWMTSYALMAYAYGLPAFVAVKIFASSFFANHDTKTPVKIAIVCVTLNVCMTLVLMQFLGHVGLALSSATTGWINALTMMWILRKRGIFLPDARLKQRMLRLLAAVLLMVAVLLGIYYVSFGYFALGQDKVLRAVVLGGMISAGGVVFSVAAVTLHVLPLQDIKRMLTRKKPVAVPMEEAE